MGSEVGIGQVQENGTVLLNTDYELYQEAKEKFSKAFKMSNHKIVRLMFKKPHTRDEMLMQLAAKMAYHQRGAEAISTLKKANDEVEAYFSGTNGSVM